MENILGIGINVTFSGIVIVFSMLVLLVLILVLFGKVGQLLKQENDPPVSNKHTLVKIEESAQSTQKSKNIVSSEPSPEIIAVIAAAVATMYEGSTVKPVIKSVRRAGVRPVWAAAGIAENTRPF